MKIITCIVAVALSALTASGQSAELRGRDTALPVYGGYFPERCEGAQCIPDEVQQQVVVLIGRLLNSDLAGVTRIVSGCVVNADEARKFGFDVKIRYSVRVRIDIHHELADYYDFRLDFDSDLNLINVPQVPSGAANADYRLLPFDELVARSMLGRSALRDATLRYDEQRKVIVWRILAPAESGNGDSRLMETLVDGVSGVVLSRTSFGTGPGMRMRPRE